MARKSRGEIETGFVDFAGTDSANVTFDVKADGNARFSSVPVVKLIAIERLDHLYKYFLFDHFERPVYEYASGGISNFGPGQDNATSTKPTIVGPSTYTNPGGGAPSIRNNWPYQDQYVQINPQQTIGFNIIDENRAQPTASDAVYLYFQFWFNGMPTDKGLQIGFMSTDSSNFTVPGDLDLDYAIDVDYKGSWVGASSDSGTGQNLPRSVMPTADPDPDEGTILWARVLLMDAGGTNATKLRGFAIKNTGTADTTQKAYIANPIIQYGSNRSDGVTFSPNVHVSFENVTTTGMTVTSSAKLHGRVRFLMSV